MRIILILLTFIPCLVNATEISEISETYSEFCDLSLEFSDGELSNVPKQVFGTEYEGSEEELKTFYVSLKDIRSLSDLPIICMDFSDAIKAVCASGHLDAVAKDFIHLNTLPEQICGPKFQGIRLINGNFVDDEGNEMKFYDSYQCRTKIWKNMQLTLQGREQQLLDKTGVRWRSPLQYLKDKFSFLSGQKSEETIIQDVEHAVAPIEATATLLLRHGPECKSIEYRKPLLQKVMTVLRDIGEFFVTHKYDIIFLVLSLVIVAATGAASGGAVPAIATILLLINYSVSSLYAGLFFAQQIYRMRKRSVVMQTFLDQLQPTIGDLKQSMRESKLGMGTCPKVDSFCPVDEPINEQFLEELSIATSVDDIDFLCRYEDPAIQNLCNGPNQQIFHKIVDIVVKWNRLPGDLCGVQFKFLRLVDSDFYRYNGTKVTRFSKRQKSICAEKLIKAAVELHEVELRRLQKVVVISNKDELMESSVSQTDLISQLMTHIRNKDEVCRNMFQVSKFKRAMSKIQEEVAVNPFATSMIVIAVMCVASTFSAVWNLAATSLMIKFISQMASNSLWVATSVSEYYRSLKLRRQGLAMRNNFLAAHMIEGVKGLRVADMMNHENDQE